MKNIFSFKMIKIAGILMSVVLGLGAMAPAYAGLADDLAAARANILATEATADPADVAAQEALAFTNDALRNTIADGDAAIGTFDSVAAAAAVEAVAAVAYVAPVAAVAYVAPVAAVAYVAYDAGTEVLGSITGTYTHPITGATNVWTMIEISEGVWEEDGVSQLQATVQGLLDGSETFGGGISNVTGSMGTVGTPEVLEVLAVAEVLEVQAVAEVLEVQAVAAIDAILATEGTFTGTGDLLKVAVAITAEQAARMYADALLSGRIDSNDAEILALQNVDHDVVSTEDGRLAGLISDNDTAIGSNDTDILNLQNVDHDVVSTEDGRLAGLITALQNVDNLTQAEFDAIDFDVVSTEDGRLAGLITTLQNVDHDVVSTEDGRLAGLITALQGIDNLTQAEFDAINFDVVSTEDGRLAGLITALQNVNHDVVSTEDGVLADRLDDLEASSTGATNTGSITDLESNLGVASSDDGAGNVVVATGLNADVEANTSDIATKQATLTQDQLDAFTAMTVDTTLDATTLATSVQGGKADTALQSSDVSISSNGLTLTVAGIAFTKTTDTDTNTQNTWVVNGDGTITVTPISGSATTFNIQGIQGVIGLTGATGAAGVAGSDGSIGLTGATGAAGVAGSDGSIGLTGATGAAGVAGSDGSIGLTGATGAAGVAGSDGSIGLTGATGAAGVAGSDGSIGLTGATGAAGVAGSEGSQGATGSNGLGFDAADTDSSGSLSVAEAKAYFEAFASTLIATLTATSFDSSVQDSLTKADAVGTASTGSVAGGDFVAATGLTGDVDAILDARTANANVVAGADTAAALLFLNGGTDSDGNTVAAADLSGDIGDNAFRTITTDNSSRLDSLDTSDYRFKEVWVDGEWKLATDEYTAETAKTAGQVIWRYRTDIAGFTPNNTDAHVSFFAQQFEAINAAFVYGDADHLKVDTLAVVSQNIEDIAAEVVARAVADIKIVRDQALVDAVQNGRLDTIEGILTDHEARISFLESLHVVDKSFSKVIDGPNGTKIVMHFDADGTQRGKARTLTFLENPVVHGEFDILWNDAGEAVNAITGKLVDPMTGLEFDEMAGFSAAAVEDVNVFFGDMFITPKTNTTPFDTAFVAEEVAPVAPFSLDAGTFVLPSSASKVGSK